MIVEKESSRPSKPTLWESDTVPPRCLSIEPVVERVFTQHPEFLDHVSLLLKTHRKRFLLSSSLLVRHQNRIASLLIADYSRLPWVTGSPLMYQIKVGEGSALVVLQVPWD